jgi:hypothetical protein
MSEAPIGVIRSARDLGPPDEAERFLIVRMEREFKLALYKVTPTGYLAHGAAVVAQAGTIPLRKMRTPPHEVTRCIVVDLAALAADV